MTMELCKNVEQRVARATKREPARGRCFNQRRPLSFCEASCGGPAEGKDASARNTKTPQTPSTQPGALLSVRRYSRKPLTSLMRDKMMLQLLFTTPGKESITCCIKRSISSLEAATACTCSLFLPVTR